jgi:uncharacterized membrane protein YhaH (DUF805 family)
MNRVPSRRGQAGGEVSRFGRFRAWLSDPTVLTVIAVGFLASALGQSLLGRLFGGDSLIIMWVFSVLGSVVLTAAIVIAARRHDRDENGDRRHRSRRGGRPTP